MSMIKTLRLYPMRDYLSGLPVEPRDCYKNLYGSRVTGKQGKESGALHYRAGRHLQSVGALSKPGDIIMVSYCAAELKNLDDI
jgi:hypothetical protein